METGIHELTAGYALDALDADERAAYEAHLPACETCQQELGSFWETTEVLAVAASGPAPSPALRERILADVRAEPAQNVVPLEPRRRRLAPVLGAVAATAAVAALAIGLWGASVSNKLDDTRSALERSEAAAAVLADPDAQSVGFQAGEGRLVVGSDGQAVLVVDGLDPAVSHHVRQRCHRAFDALDLPALDTRQGTLEQPDAAQQQSAQQRFAKRPLEGSGHAR